MDLFDYIDTVFSKRGEFENVTNSVKKKHFFMLQRFLSIKHPKEVNRLNINRINEVEVSKYWHMIMIRLYSRKPEWLRTQTRKTAKEKKKDRFEKFDKEIIKAFVLNQGMNKRDFEFAIEMDDSDVYNGLVRMEAFIKDK